MDNKKAIEKAIEDELWKLCLKIEAKLNYSPIRLIAMIDNHGGLKTLKRLIDRPEPSAGYKRLAKLNALDFTAEMLLVEHVEWHPLFKNNVLAIAFKRTNQT